MQRHKHYMGPSALRASALHGSMVPSSARGAAGERDFELKDARKRCKSVPSLRDLEEEYRRKRAEEIEKKKEIEEDMRYRQERMRQYQERAHQRTMTKEATWSRVTRDQHHRVQLERARGGFGRPFPAPRAPERKKSVSSDRVVELRRRIFELEDIVEKQSEELEIIIGAKAEVEFTPSPTRRRMRIQNLDGEQNVDTINSRSLVTDRPNKYAVDYSLLSLSLDDDDDRVDSSVTGQKSARSQDPFSNRSTSRVSTLDRSGSRVALCRTTTHVDRSAGRQLMSSRSAKTSSTGHAGGGIKAPRGSSSSSSVSTTTSNVRSNTRTTSNNTGTSGTSNSSSSNNRSSANRRYWDNRSKCIKMPQPLSLQGSTTRGARAHDVRTVEPHHQDRSSSQSTISMLKTGGKSCRSLREQELQEFEHQERTIDRIMSTTTTRHSIKHDEEVTPRLPTLRPASEEKLSPVKTTRSFGTEEVSPLKRLNLTKEMDDEDESDVESEVESESADEKDDEENDELDSDSADADEVDVDEKDDEDKAAVRYKEGETLSDSERSERSDSDSNPSTPDEESAQDNWTSNAASYFADLASMSSAERREVINEQSGASQLDLHDKEYVSRELSMDNDEDVLSRAADFEIFIYLNNRLENGSLLKMHTRGVLEPIEEVEEELETTRRPLKRSYDSFKPRTRSCPASPYDEDVLEEAPRITRSPSKGGRDTRSREPGISSSSSPNELPIHSPPHSNSSNTQPATTIPGLVSVRSLGGKTSSSNANSSSKGTKKELALRLTPTTTTTTPTPTTTTTPRQDKRVDNNTPGTGTGARDRRRSVTQDEPDTMAEEQARKRECEIREEEKRRQQEREAETEEWRRRQELLESAKVEREKRIQRERVKERRRREQEALAGEQRRQESEQDARAIEDRSQEAYRKRKALENGINLRAVEDDENGGEQSEYDEEESVQGFVEEESEEGESEEEESEEGESEEGSEEEEEESEEGESREDKEEFVEEEGSKELSEEEDEHHKKEVKQDGKHAPMEAPPLTGVLGECPSRSGAGKVELEANTSISVKQRALELEMCPISIPTKGGGTTTAISLPVSTSTTPTSKVKSLVAAWNSGNTPRACDDNNNAIESTKTTLPSEIPPTKFKVALAVQDWVRGVRKNNTQTDDEDDEEEDEEEKDGEEEEVPTTTKPIPATREHTQAQHNRAQSHNENSRGLSHMFARKTDMNTKTRKKSFHTEQMELVLKLQGRG